MKALERLKALLALWTGQDDLQEALTELEEELSHNDVRQALRAAVQGLLPQRHVWIRDVFDGYFIFEDEGPRGPSLSGPAPAKLYRMDYSAGDNGITLTGTPVEVIQRTIYEPVVAPVAESAEEGDLIESDVVPLEEKAMRRDGTVALKIIQPGWGSSGYYPAEVLKRDGPKVFTKGLKSYWDHPTASQEAERPERSLRDLAAELVSDARWEDNGPAGPGLYADAKVFGGYKEAVEELAPHIGVSIRALGRAKKGEAEGRKGQVIEALTAARSVDFVTVPGAGGQVLQMFEAAGRAPSSGEVTLEEGEDMEKLEEAQKALTEALERAQRAEEALVLREAQGVVSRELAKIEMPDVTRTRLQEALAKNPPVKEGALDEAALVAAVTEAATAEIAYLASVTGAGQIRGMGASTTVETTEADVATSLEESFARLGLGESARKIAAQGR
jgi:hypothetical protein